MNLILILSILLVIVLIVLYVLNQNEMFQLINNFGDGPAFGLTQDEILGSKFNNNIGFFPATHFKKPSFQQCLDYALKVGKGKITEEANTKLIMCVQQAGMRPWMKNLPISSPGV